MSSADCKDEVAETGCSPEVEAKLLDFAQEFYRELRVLTRQYIEHFFANRMLHCGGPIPRSLLCTDNNISMVMNYDILKGVDRAYAALESRLTGEEVRSSRQTGEITSDIRLVNDTLNLLAKAGVPQQFAGGMLVLYLRFIEGVEINDRQKRLLKDEDVAA